MIFDASIAFRIRTEVRASSIPEAGNGVFALHGVPRGRFIGMDFPSYRKLCTDRDVPELSDEVQEFSWRHIEHVCFEAHDGRAATDLLNHSFTPNVFWHVGYYFACQEIQAGDELFMDYRHLMSAAWDSHLVDAVTGRRIDGIEWRETLVRSCRELADLLEETADTAGTDDLDHISALCQSLRYRE